MAIKRTYPGLTRLKDPNLATLARTLFDRVYDLQDASTAADALAAEQRTSIAALQDELIKTRREAKAALALASTPIAAPVGGGEPPPPGEGGDGGGGSDDDGQGSSGCSQAGATGHVDPSLPKDLTTVGMIVCGTGNEFAALKAVTVDLPTREANAEELVRRMIWHLQQHGFVAGRQNNSSSGVRISSDKLTVQVDGVWWAYDVMGAWDDFTEAISTRMGPVAPARYIADGGVAD